MSEREVQLLFQVRGTPNGLVVGVCSETISLTASRGGRLLGEVLVFGEICYIYVLKV